MDLYEIQRKAKDGSLEVEDLIQAAKTRGFGLGDALRQLSKELNWSMESNLSNGSQVVPLSRWAVLISAYADGGFSALEKYSGDNEFRAFVVGLIIEINSPESICALFELFHNEMSGLVPSCEFTFVIVEAVNYLFSVKMSPRSSSEQRTLAAQFLNRVFPHARTNLERAMVMYAMRGCGDGESLRLLADASEPEAPYMGARSMAIRCIKRRLRKSDD
jgi:hypothetical protein